MSNIQQLAEVVAHSMKPRAYMYHQVRVFGEGLRYAIKVTYYRPFPIPFQPRMFYTLYYPQRHD